MRLHLQIIHIRLLISIFPLRNFQKNIFLLNSLKRIDLQSDTPELPKIIKNKWHPLIPERNKFQCINLQKFPHQKI